MGIVVLVKVKSNTEKNSDSFKDIIPNIHRGELMASFDFSFVH